ncbi:DeoR/GlpR family DNA-binding transcription regulator [Salinicoccus hispanicus]|uniref:DeoR family transcriptional regulator n=1 Tax=Salinicoccus hispanicus TaxID=157225 RepID=A0A6N8TZ07_9STAP|nr:DeoR/GlpR family DNA-binding transcription regulator [Salinicoccus hispanicus]MXQ51020.1 DeoR family transcriptional regulator [Salinicoccus hispanicus]
MLVAERHQKIVELVKERKSIRVSELSDIFSVTEETIRRDLEKLEKESKLARSHGGAVYVSSVNNSEIPYFQREIMNVSEKKEIALEAAKLIKEGDKVILDASSTAWYVAKALPDIPLTVLTNSIKVAMELSNKKQIEVISSGGILQTKSLSFVGPLAESSMESYHVNKAFISCKGLHLERGISDSNEQQARIKRKMIEISDTVYVMIDNSKFGVKAFSNICSLDEIDHIITDSEVNPNIFKNLKDRALDMTKVNLDKASSSEL